MKKVIFLLFLSSVFSISGVAQKSNVPVKSVKPTATKPIATKPKTTTNPKPVVAKPIVGKPTTAKPVATKPVATKSVAAKPITAKPVVVKPVAAKPIAAEISEAEWKVLADALQAEDWTKSASTAALYLQKLKADNDKKQLAQLRYLRLYALAGKISAVSGANVPADTDALWKDLDDAASEFNGKEFVLPPHSYLNECEKRVNYICRVADNDRALRVTATNQEGTAIHSFDYVVFDDKNMLTNLPESQLFLGGTLKRIEYNQDASKPWVMRLTYEKGFVSSVNK